MMWFTQAVDNLQEAAYDKQCPGCSVAKVSELLCHHWV